MEPAQSATWTPLPSSEDLLGAWRRAGRYPGAVCVAGGILLPEPLPERGGRPNRAHLAADPDLIEAILWGQPGEKDRWWVVDRPERALVRLSLLLWVAEDPAGELREGLYERWVETPWRETHGWSWRMEHTRIGPGHLRVRAWVEPGQVPAVLAAVDELKTRIEQSDPASREALRARGAHLLAIDAALGRRVPDHAAPTIGSPTLQVLMLGDLREIPVELWSDPRWPAWRPDMAEVLERAVGLGAEHCPG